MKKKIYIPILLVLIVFLNNVITAQNEFNNDLNSQMKSFFKTILIQNYGDMRDTTLYKFFTESFLEHKDEFELKLDADVLIKINKSLFTVKNYYNYYSRIVFVENIYGLSPSDKTVYPTVYIQTKNKSAINEDKVHRYKIYLNKKILNTFKAQNIEKNLLKEFCNKTNSEESISYMLFLNFLKTDYSYMNYEENQQIFAIIFWRYLCESNGIRFLNRGSLD